MTDYRYVYQTAWKLAIGEPVDDWYYFSMWTNNLGNLSLLTVLMKIGLLMGFQIHIILYCL